jgi:hypothetical protein
MVLLMAYQQRGGEGTYPQFDSFVDCFLKPHIEAIPAPLPLMPHHPPEILYKIVAIDNQQVKPHILREGFYGLKTILMLHIRVYIGIIPQGDNIVSLLLPVLDSISSTMGTTTVD